MSLATGAATVPMILQCLWGIASMVGRQEWYDASPPPSSSVVSRGGNSSIGSNSRWLLSLIPLLFQRFSALLDVLQMFLIHREHSSFVPLSNFSLECGGICTSIGCLHAFDSSYRCHYWCTGLSVSAKEYCCGNSHLRAIRCCSFLSLLCGFQRRKYILHSAPTLLGIAAPVCSAIQRLH